MPGAWGASPARASIAMPRAHKSRRPLAWPGEGGLLRRRRRPWRARRSACAPEGISVTDAQAQACCESATPPWRCPTAAWPASAPAKTACNLVLLDLALDYASATRIAISHAANCTARGRDQASPAAPPVAGQRHRRPARPGGAAHRGHARQRSRRRGAARGRHAADIDLAMRAGVNYPRGPLAWADSLGVGYTLRVLDNLQRSWRGTLPPFPAAAPPPKEAACMTDLSPSPGAPAPRPCSPVTRPARAWASPARRRPRQRPPGHDRARRHDPGPRHLPRRLSVRPGRLGLCLRLQQL
jgi:hypothetical protein